MAPATGGAEVDVYEEANQPLRCPCRDPATCGVLICDRDAKWSAAMRERLSEAGIRIVQTPYQAPNANAYAERFVRSIKEECLNRMIPLGERHFRRGVTQFVEDYHRERN